MRVILLQNVPKIGRQGDIKDVADGYARNFLLPKKLATAATPEAIAQQKTQLQKAAKQAELDLAATEKLASQLEGQAFEVSAKASENDTLYAAISPAKIVSLLKSRGFTITRNQVNTEGIKEIGEHEIKLSFDHGLEATITIIVNPQT